MKSINHAFNGLVSSLLLNVGFTSLAEKLDPLFRQGGALKDVQVANSCTFCELPCAFAPQAAQPCTFCELPCAFTPQAAQPCTFCELPCAFTPQSAN